MGGVRTARKLLAELNITLTDVVNSGGHTVSRTHKPPNWARGSKPMGRLLVGQVESYTQQVLYLDYSLMSPYLYYPPTQSQSILAATAGIGTDVPCAVASRGGGGTTCSGGTPWEGRSGCESSGV